MRRGTVTIERPAGPDLRPDTGGPVQRGPALAPLRVSDEWEVAPDAACEPVGTGRGASGRNGDIPTHGGDSGTWRPADLPAVLEYAAYPVASLPIAKGLLIPRFGRDTIRTIQIAAETEKPAPQLDRAARRRREREKGRPKSLTPVRVISEQITDSGNGQAVLHTRLKTITSVPIDGTAAIAEELLRAGVLREDDFKNGSVVRSINDGLTRWANKDMGCGSFRILPRLSLVYTDDHLAYSSGMRLPRWREYLDAYDDRPIGFFGIRADDVYPVRVHVRRAVEALESAFPGYGYGLLNQLQMAFTMCLEGYTFAWGRSFLLAMQQLAPQAELAGVHGPLTIGDFDEIIPKGAWSTDWKLDNAERVYDEMANGHRVNPYKWRRGPDVGRFGAVPELAMNLYKACRACGKDFYLNNHIGLMSWHTSYAERESGMQARIDQDKLARSPVAYTVWDDDDPMRRLVDDYNEMMRGEMAFTDLTWMHAFMVDWPGRVPKASYTHLERKERLVQKIAKSNPEYISWLDKEWKHTPLTDGSVGHAIKALGHALRMVTALDALLFEMHCPAEEEEIRIRIPVRI